MDGVTLLTRVFCRAGCLAAALAALVAFSPRSGLRSSRERSILAADHAAPSITAEARALARSDAAHRRVSPTLLRALGQEIDRVSGAAPTVSGREIQAPFTPAFAAAHSPRAPPAPRDLPIRAS